MVNPIYSNSLVLGESPVWDEQTQTLFFVDILEKKLFCYSSIEKTVKQHDFSEYISFIALHQDHGKIIVALQSGVYFYCLLNRELTFIVQPEKKSNYRFNDGMVDGQGNLLLGSMNNRYNESEETPLFDASLYLIHGKESHVLMDEVSISNGLSIQGDQLYYIDSNCQNLRRFTYQQGRVSQETELINFTSQGTPDGMTLSKSGKLYIAMWGGGKIIRYDIAQAKITGTIDLPFLNPTSCSFGGPAMNELFITSAYSEEDAKGQPGVVSVVLEDEGFFENRLQWD